MSIYRDDSEPIDFTMEAKQIIQKYTSWETMEDIHEAKAKYYQFGKDSESVSEFKSDINHLEKDLERMEKLHSDLKDYERDYYKKSLHDLIEIAKQKIVGKFPGVQNNDFFTKGDDYNWVAVIQGERTVDDEIDYCYGCSCRFFSPSLSLTSLAYGRNPFASRLPQLETDDDTEVRLNELYEELATDRSNVLEANNLCTSSYTVCSKVESLIRTLKLVIEGCKLNLSREIYRQEDRREEECERKEWEEKQQEARRLVEENLYCLCSVMKEALGDRVVNVVVSSVYSVSPCSLRDSDMGGKTMEIIPDNRIIEDLRKRCDADKNDIHVRNATLLLFNYADLYNKSSN